jgi:microcystin-dependent protein
MTDQFVGEIRIFAGNFAPTGWAMCNGQLLPISQNTALFSLLGTYYGGDGKSTFALPNLEGSVPLHQGQGPGLSDYVIGQSGGEQNVTLITTEMPVHNHQAMGIAGGDQTAPGPGVVWGSLAGRNPPPLYASGNPDVTMSPFATGVVGSSFPHNNLQPLLVLNFIIAQQGIFPARS